MTDNIDEVKDRFPADDEHVEAGRSKPVVKEANPQDAAKDRFPAGDEHVESVRKKTPDTRVVTKQDRLSGGVARAIVGEGLEDPDKISGKSR